MDVSLTSGSTNPQLPAPIVAAPARPHAGAADTVTGTARPLPAPAAHDPVAQAIAAAPSPDPAEIAAAIDRLPASIRYAPGRPPQGVPAHSVDSSV